MTTLQSLYQYLYNEWDIKGDEWDINEHTGTVEFKYCVTQKLSQSQHDGLVYELMTNVLPAGISVWFSLAPGLTQMPELAKAWLARWGRR
jgi:hypothetical protein